MNESMNERMVFSLQSRSQLEIASMHTLNRMTPVQLFGSSLWYRGTSLNWLLGDNSGVNQNCKHCLGYLSFRTELIIQSLEKHLSDVFKSTQSTFCRN